MNELLGVWDGRGEGEEGGRGGGGRGGEVLGTEAAGDSLTPQFIVEEPNLASVVWEGRAGDVILEKIRVRSTGEWCYGEENMSKIWVRDVRIGEGQRVR